MKGSLWPETLKARGFAFDLSCSDTPCWKRRTIFARDKHRIGLASGLFVRPHGVGLRRSDAYEVDIVFFIAS